MNRNWLRSVAVAAVAVAAAIFLGAVAGGVAGIAMAMSAIAAVVLLAMFLAGRVALSAFQAQPVSEVEYPELYRVVREISKAARLPVPRIYVSPALQPNSFAAGRSRRSAVVCCTEGLLRLLSADELRGVLAHELAHVRERDTIVTSFSAGLAALITSVSARPGSRPRVRRISFSRAGCGARTAAAACWPGSPCWCSGRSRRCSCSCR